MSWRGTDIKKSRFQDGQIDIIRIKQLGISSRYLTDEGRFELSACNP
jgi:hypothetical protein